MTASATQFAIVAVFQVRENYAAHDGFTGEYYWKCKGGEEAVSDLMSLDTLMGMDQAAKEALVASIAPESNDYYEHTLIDWEIVSLDSESANRVADFIAESPGEDIDFLRYKFGNDFLFDWAVKQRPEIAKNTSDPFGYARRLGIELPTAA